MIDDFHPSTPLGMKSFGVVFKDIFTVSEVEP